MRTLEIDTITGQITVGGRDFDTIGPGGAEEEDMGRADEAVTGSGYIRTSDWRRSPLNDNLWSCTVAHPSELAAVAVTFGGPTSVVKGLGAAAELINEYAQRYPGEYAAYTSIDLLSCCEEADPDPETHLLRWVYSTTIGGRQVTATWAER